MAVHHITDHGARSDADSLCTASIQAAIDDAHAAGGGRVLCGAGTWRTGSLELKSRVELHLAAGCRLVGSEQVDDYHEVTAPGFRHQFAAEGSSKSLLWAVGARDLAITGPGTIDGRGLAFYDTANTAGRFFAKPSTPRPRMVTFYACEDVHLQDTTFLDSPCWTIWLLKCARVGVRGIRILGDQRMINNDGLDLDSCRDVTVSDCLFRTADDCLVLRSIRRVYDEPAPCENITVSNCVMDSWCQAIRIGCPGDGVVRHATLANLVIRSELHGITLDFPHRYLREPPATAEVYDVQFSNVTIEAKNLPVRVTVEDGIDLPRLSDLSFHNLRIRSGGPFTIAGSDQTVIRYVRVSNTVIETDGPGLDLRRCQNVALDGVEVRAR